MEKKTILAILVAAWAAFCMQAARVEAAQAGPEVVIKVASLAPRGSNIATLFEEISQEVYEKTGGAVRFKTYWGGVQGDEQDVLRKVRLGQLHGGAFMGPTLGLIAPEVRVTDLPYIFRNYDEADYVRSKLRPEMERLIEAKGFKVLGWLNLGFVYTFSKVPLDSLETARRQKWWALEGDPVGQAFYRELGITPVSLSISDVATSLSSNMVDCAPATPFGAVALQWYTRFRYMSEYPSSSVYGAMLVRKDVWERVPPQAREVILETASRQYEKIKLTVRAEDDRALELLRKSGIRVMKADFKNKDAAFVFEAAKRARENLVGRLYSRELLDRMLGLVEEYRRLHPEDRRVIRADQ